MKKIALIFLLYWAGLPLAWGHAGLLSTTPPNGAVLEQAPDNIQLRFNEPVNATVLRWISPDGQTSTLAATGQQGTDVQVPLPNQVTPGTYFFSWRVVSADGHPVAGTLTYALGQNSPGLASAAAISDPDSTSRHLFIWLTRWLGYLCLFAAVGAALFRAMMPNASTDNTRWIVIAAGMGCGLLPLALVLQGLDLLAAPWGQSLSAAVWQQALASPYASTLGLMGLALLMAAAVGRIRRKPLLKRAGLIALMLAGAALAASGHASTAPPQSLSRMAVFLHVATAIAWIGALIPLALELRPGKLLGLSILNNFSRWISPIVAVLLISGASLAWLQLTRAADLWQTAYGQVLAAKLALVAVLLGAAAYNRWKLTKPALQGQRPARQALRHSIRVEIILAVAVLAVVSLWRFTPPPRNINLSTSPVAATIPATTVSISRVAAQVTPGAPDWAIHLSRPDGQPFAAKQVSLLLSNPDAEIETLTIPATQQSLGLWAAQPPFLPNTGHWLVGVQILVNDFEQISLSNSC